MLDCLCLVFSRYENLAESKGAWVAMFSSISLSTILAYLPSGSAFCLASNYYAAQYKAFVPRENFLPSIRSPIMFMIDDESGESENKSENDSQEEDISSTKIHLSLTEEDLSKSVIALANDLQAKDPSLAVYQSPGEIQQTLPVEILRKIRPPPAFDPTLWDSFYDSPGWSTNMNNPFVAAEYVKELREAYGDGGPVIARLPLSVSRIMTDNQIEEFLAELEKRAQEEDDYDDSLERPEGMSSRQWSQVQAMESVIDDYLQQFHDQYHPTFESQMMAIMNEGTEQFQALADTKSDTYEDDRNRLAITLELKCVKVYSDWYEARQKFLDDNMEKIKEKCQIASQSV